VKAREHTGLLSSGLAAVLLAAGLAGACPADVSAQIEQHVLGQEWEKARIAVTGDDTLAADPVARLLTGHACLATNRNNEAMLLFMSIRDPEPAGKCVAWVQGLAERHRESAVAQYLMGDALARAGRLDEAIDAFDRSLAIDPGFGLAWNARGVARAAKGDMDDALMDLTQATRICPDLADAHANLGTYWVLMSVAPGAIQSFDRAIALDPACALAYNGRGCARFGKGDYDGAIEDLEKAFDLCPALVPVGANEVLVLSALAAEAAPEQAAAQPGTTITTRSDLASVDYSKLSAPQRQAFHDSLEQLSKADKLDALNVTIAQRANLGLRMQDAMTDLTKYSAMSAKTARVGDQLRRWDTVLAALPIIDPKVSVVARGGWKQALDLTGKGLGIAAGLSEPGSAARTWFDVGQRTIGSDLIASPALGGTKAFLRVGNYLLSEGVGVWQTKVDAAVMHASAKAALYRVQDAELQRAQGSVLAGMIRDNFDLSKVNAFGAGRAQTRQTATIPIREYRIPSTAPVTQFGVLPGATAKSIATRGQKPFVLVEGGHLTDAYRLGTALRGYDALGVQTIPVPKGMDGRQLMKTLGLSSAQTAIVKITPDSFDRTRAYTLPSRNPSSGRPPGGVTTEGQYHFDRGKWPVVTAFLLAYAPSPPDDSGKARDETR
jgi:tetratricopeptide (TPR) repeat protein